MNKLIIIPIILIVICTLNIHSQGQITQGAQPGELYLSTDWYMDNNGQIHYAIFYTDDNGEHISLQYENLEVPLPGEMKVGTVLGDATPGALYNYGNNELWVSFDYGGTWMLRESIGTDNRFSSGTIEGEIYKYCKNPTSFMYRSENYGQTFEEINSGVFGFPEVGTNEGELYMLTGATWPNFYIEMLFSTDFGYTFLNIAIDSSTYGYYISGIFPEISRGTYGGEIYLVSWWPDYHYKIFHSVDTGYTWTQKFESEYISVYYWRVAYTAGREPGSFYVMRSRVNEAGDHVWLYIDYSNDYGETFTTYFHDLDSTLTSIESVVDDNIKITNYPNPFSVKTIIEFTLPKSCYYAELFLYDIYGNIIRQYDITGKTQQQWDGRNSKGNPVANGIYFYNIKYGNYTSKINKIVFIP
jgi:hypothetical protein